MHTCPECGQACDCSGDIDDAEVMRDSWVYARCEHECEESDEDFLDGEAA